ncbi:MAG: hypothetical protein ACTS3F_12950 [Phycisphaerales bacterium]
MKVVRDDGNRIVLSGPPGGKGTVVLLLVVGTAFLGGAWLFATAGAGATQSPSGGLGNFFGNLMPKYGVPIICGAIGGIVFSFGVGSAVARDRLVLDKVTNACSWTRTILGYPLSKPIEFELRFAKHVKIERFVETQPGGPNGGGGGWSHKSRARLLITKPRRAIVLDEGERQNEPRVRGVGEAVARFLDLPLEGPSADDPDEGEEL